MNISTTSSSYDVTLSYDLNVTTNITSSIDITKERTVATVLCLFLLLCSAYLVSSLSYFRYRTVLKNRAQVCQKKFSRRYTLFKKWSEILCLIAASFAILRIVLELVEIFTGEFSSSTCLWIRHAKVFLLCAAAGSINSVLWLRQWQFYNTPALHHLSTNITRLFNKAMIFIMIGTSAVVPIMHIAVRSYASSVTGCVLAWTNVPVTLFETFYFTFATTCQAILLGLFGYPLIKYRRPNIEGRDTRKIRILKRAGCAAIIVIATTVTSGASFFTPPVTKYLLLGHLFLDLDIMISLLSVIISFGDWRERLAPCLVGKELDSSVRESEAASTNRTKITSKV